MAESFDFGTLVEEFRDEAREQLDRVDAGLLELEREGALDEEARGSLLRTLHTLKGNAGMLGLSPVRDFVHGMENVLKTQEPDWPEPVLEGLFAGAAALRGAVDAAGTDRQGSAFRELTAVRHRLEGVAAGGGSGAEGRGRSPEGRAGEGPVDIPAGTGDLVRVPFGKLDALLAEVGDLLGEAAALEAEAEGAGGEVRDLSAAVARRADRIRDSVMGLRLVPLGRVLGRFHGLTRRLARQQGKEARLVVEGEATEVDKSTADALGDPLLHLVRNAIDHGIAPPREREAAGKPSHGTVRIRATQAGDRVRLEVSDDGGGLDLDAIRERAVEAGLIEAGATPPEEELVQLIFRPGFSTRADVSTVSGRGVGLDVVAQTIRDLRGDVTVERPEEGGTRFVVRLPLTVAIVPSLVFEAAGEILALPTAYVARTLRVTRTERVGGAEVVREEASIHPVATARGLFGWDAEPGPFGILLERDGRSAVLRVDRVVEQRALVVKAMPAYGAPAPVVTGGSVLPGGRVILLLDPGEVIRLNEGESTGGEGAAAR